MLLGLICYSMPIQSRHLWKVEAELTPLSLGKLSGEQTLGAHDRPRAGITSRGVFRQMSIFP